MINDNIQKHVRRLREMRLPTMAEQLLLIMDDKERLTLGIEEVLDRMIESEYLSRKNNSISKLKKKAKFPQPNASFDEFNYNPNRKLNLSVIKQLQTNDYIRDHRNIILLGSNGTGKSYIANALGNLACEELHSVLYLRTYELLDNMVIARRSLSDPTGGSYRYTKCDVLILDDFLLDFLSTSEQSDLFRIFEERHGYKSTIICSQYDPVEWHQRLGGKVIADSIIDRITSRSFQMILEGESLRDKST